MTRGGAAANEDWACSSVCPAHWRAGRSIAASASAAGVCVFSVSSRHILMLYLFLRVCVDMRVFPASYSTRSVDSKGRDRERERGIEWREIDEGD